MEDEVVVGFPNRAWAESAIVDLAAEGCIGELLEGPVAKGLWQVRITGCPDKLPEIRHAVEPPCLQVDWEAFVNATVKDF